MRISVKHRIDDKGRVLLPKEAMEQAGFKKGDEIVFDVVKGCVCILRGGSDE